ncbi:MAG TPA: molybdopterin-guanine dinucleotide biosynthesis protein B [Spirochaetota bacterium]|nr:molybdopterin-guanine dinucleotide biosynthesis protein B [Spirochaetota bacterium]
MNIPIVSIVGRSNTGKTTLVEKLVAELTRRGRRVATIKHNLHGFDIDHEGKDSFRHKQAGAVMTVIASAARVALVKDIEGDMTIDEIAARFIDDADIIITEGYKGNDKAKIEVHRREAYPDLLCGAGDNLLAVATDTRLSIDVPQYDINDAHGLCDLIEREALAATRGPTVTLTVDGAVVPLKPFVQAMLANGIRGMVSGLKECADARELRIAISARAPEER